jgi:hypothetical protein
MNDFSDLEDRAIKLQADFADLTGGRSDTFYCPITFEDGPVELCRGHIIPEAFPGSDRSWTVQRKDVDGFYGSTFEADFVALRHKGSRSAVEGLTDVQLGRELKPAFRLDDRQVEYYRPTGPVPPQHTPVCIDTATGPVRVVLKLAPSELLAAQDRRWELGFERDLRLPVLVTAIKCAHLTLFHLLGYRYALSAGGHFVGRDVLGRFFERNRGRSRSAVTAAGAAHFAQYSNMVRPLESWPEPLTGTLSDGKLYLCKTAAWPWAMMVFVRTGTFMHAVMIPCFEQDHAVARYLGFLNGQEVEVTGYLTEFAGEQWNVSTEPKRFHWPNSRFSE